MGTTGSNWGSGTSSLSLLAWTEYVLIDDAREQTRFCESKTNADADKLFVSEIEDFNLPNSERL